MNNDKKEFLSRLDSLVEKLNITAVELGEMADISPTTLSRWQSSEEMPTVKSTRKISNSTGCSFEWLRCGAGEMFTNNNNVSVSSSTQSVAAGGDVGSIKYVTGEKSYSESVKLAAELMERYGNAVFVDQVINKLLKIKNLTEGK